MAGVGRRGERATASRAVRAAIIDRGFDDAAVSLAVTEAVTNVVRRSFKLRAESSLGMGLALIRELCSSVRIDPTSAGTTVTMHFIKNVDAPETVADDF